MASVLTFWGAEPLPEPAAFRALVGLPVAYLNDVVNRVDLELISLYVLHACLVYAYMSGLHVWLLLICLADMSCFCLHVMLTCRRVHVDRVDLGLIADLLVCRAYMSG
eukprot:1989374-Rhodomonas_salina.1